MRRFIEVRERYGWRLPFVVGAIAMQRWIRLRERISVMRFFLCTKGFKGSGLWLGRDIRATPGGFLALSNGVSLGDRCTFEIGVNPEARVTVGENTWISRDFHLQSAGCVSIGRSVLVGEFVSVRDTTHSYGDSDLPIREQPDVISSIAIEDGVWIGRGCLIQASPPGLTVGRGAIIGANSVVNRPIPAMEIWGGVPARMLKRRGQTETTCCKQSRTEDQ